MSEKEKEDLALELILHKEEQRQPDQNKNLTFISLIVIGAVGLLYSTTYDFFVEKLMSSQVATLTTNSNIQAIQKTEVIKITTISSASKDDKIAVVTIWDYKAGDDDTVRVQTSRVSIDVITRKEPITLKIPYKNGDNIKFIGLYDGGYGITTAIELMGRPIPLPIMSIGQTVTLPLL